MIQLPGWFISTMAETRSAVPSKLQEQLRHWVPDCRQGNNLKPMAW